MLYRHPWSVGEADEHALRCNLCQQKIQIFTNATKYRYGLYQNWWL